MSCSPLFLWIFWYKTNSIRLCMQYHSWHWNSASHKSKWVITKIRTLYYSRTTLNCTILCRTVSKHLEREEGNNENNLIMIDCKAFFISSWYISSLSRHVKQTWSDIRLQENCIKNKTAINQCLYINYGFNFMDHNSDQSVCTETVTDLLTSLLFSIHYIRHKNYQIICMKKT